MSKIQISIGAKMGGRSHVATTLFRAECVEGYQGKYLGDHITFNSSSIAKHNAHQEGELVTIFQEKSMFGTEWKLRDSTKAVYPIKNVSIGYEDFY